MAVEQHAIHIPKTESVHLEKAKRSHLTFGVALVLLGILFLVKQVGLIEITWPLILMVIGVSSLAESWLNRSTTGVFPGIFLMLLGLIFLADGNNWISGGVTRNWPLVVLALSISLMLSPIVKQSRRRASHPGVILLAAGFFLLVVEYNWIQWWVLNDILRWWPIVLLVIGAWYLFHNTLPSKAREGDGNQ
ncbi:hypothetical protein KQI63_01085 [bacterium]|nr:hypothetical protein [bacterium]